ncbi:calnexin-like isoform X2 [Phymastichus coffea]|uniref:calnexin-like isoform X2 n=1 Tax=Phymastichus coffea TaxID=108790 RepID=UPI00273CA489|nr:calnexin-like isoform X2 [Phymastichus coffea]
MEKLTICLLFLVSASLLGHVHSTQATEADIDAEVVIENEPDEPPVATYESPRPIAPVLLAENFDDKDQFEKTWVKSQAKKEDIDEDIAKYDGVWLIEEPKRNVEGANLGLVLKSKARHAAISTVLEKPFKFEDKPLVVQYEVIFQEGQECGGAYLKLLSLDFKHKDLNNFHDKTPYTIMFGPDKCGGDHKLHFIFRHKNPLNGSVEEKHAKKPNERLEDFFKDKQPHLYTLIVRPDNTFVIKVDGTIVNEGSLLDDFTPPVNPPLEIEDPNDKQPEDWDEREKIPDPTAVKPDDWDEDAPAQIIDESDVIPDGWLENEPATIPNPESVKPEDWDEEMDGEWEPPEVQNPKCVTAPGCGPYKKRLISNPKYKGKWLPPLINNPNYQGKWKPRLIHNPDYFNDENPFKMTPIYALGFELWSMSPDILFDNIIVADDEYVAEKWAEQTFEVRKRKIAKDATGFWQGIVDFTAENPWIWAIYIILLGLPVMLIIYCCCFTSQEMKEPSKNQYEADTDDLIDSNKENVDDVDEEEPEETKEPIDEETTKKSSGKEELENSKIIESNKETSSSTEGPRRRKPNKE